MQVEGQSWTCVGYQAQGIIGPLKDLQITDAEGLFPSSISGEWIIFKDDNALKKRCTSRYLALRLDLTQRGVLIGQELNLSGLHLRQPGPYRAILRDL